MARVRTVTLVLLFGLASAAWCDLGVNPEVEDQLHSISQSILSPFCPGRALSECPSSQAAELKHEIRDRLTNGETREAILESLYSRYGKEIQAVPSAEGFDLLAWLVPIGFVLGGIGLAVLWLRSQIGSEGE